MPSKTTRNDGTFIYLLLLTGFFLLFEISFFIQCNSFYLSDFEFVSGKIAVPLSVVPPILFFLATQLSLHLAFCISAWLLANLIDYIFPVSPTKKWLLSVGVWLIGLITLLISNQYFFPNSKFAQMTEAIFPSIIAFPLLVVCLVSCSIIVILAMLGFLKLLINKTRILFLSVALFTIVFLWCTHPISSFPINNFSQPNVIIVGVDSLRPDFLGYFGQDQSTPFFDGFLNQATVFNESLTPLARTFPSWTAILTGQYPRETGVRSNLANQEHLQLSHSLPALLRQQGYETIYATDETRFSNVSKNFGFDRIISPPVGLNDFLIGTFNDFPISNLLVNTPIGKRLFPYSYGNRPVYFTYEPNSFLNLLAPALTQPRTKPLFLAIHFCLVHSPYTWATLPETKFSALENYQASVSRADEQLNDFFKLLKQDHLLDHAIVVLLSDHGEALELSGDRITDQDLFIPASQNRTIPKFYPPSLDNETVNQSAGHGTDVLGLTQYHTLLAFKLYGLTPTNPHEVSQLVSLLDIKPTILSLLKLPSPQSSGQSLAAFIEGKPATFKEHPLFLESDFSPEAIRTVYPETRKVVLEGINLFQINPVTTRLTVKDSMNQMIIRSKQYAVIDGNWILALYPQNNRTRMPILVNLVTGEWTNNLQSNFAKQSPGVLMFQQLRQFYGSEIGNV